MSKIPGTNQITPRIPENEKNPGMVRVNFLLEREKYNKFKSILQSRGISITEVMKAEVERVLYWSDK